MKQDQRLVQSVLVDTVTLLCRNGLGFDRQLRIQGVIGITVDKTDTFIVHINETYNGRSTGNVATESSDVCDGGVQEKICGGSMDEKFSPNAVEDGGYCDVAAGKNSKQDRDALVKNSLPAGLRVKNFSERISQPRDANFAARRQSDGCAPQNCGLMNEEAVEDARSSSVGLSCSQSDQESLDKPVLATDKQLSDAEPSSEHRATKLSHPISAHKNPSQSLQPNLSLCENSNNTKRGEEDDRQPRSHEGAGSMERSYLIAASDDEQNSSNDVPAMKLVDQASGKVDAGNRLELRKQTDTGTHFSGFRVKSESATEPAEFREYSRFVEDNAIGQIFPLRAQRRLKPQASEFGSADALSKIKSEREEAGEECMLYDEGHCKMDGEGEAWDADELAGFSGGSVEGTSARNWVGLADLKGFDGMPAMKNDSMTSLHSRVSHIPYRLPPGRRPAGMRLGFSSPYAARPGRPTGVSPGYELVSRFVCAQPGCGASFSNKHNLQRHQTNKHGREKCYRNRHHVGGLGMGSGQYGYDEMGAYIDGGSGSSFGQPASTGLGDMGDTVD